jgi:hypothetical protein
MKGARKTEYDISKRVSDMMDWENGSLSDERTIALFQNLIDVGIAWSLQGAYGRFAQELIDQGYCHVWHENMP